MLSTDDRKAALKTFVDDLEGDERLKALDRSFLTTYKTALDSGTTRNQDLQLIGVFERFMVRVMKNR